MEISRSKLGLLMVFELSRWASGELPVITVPHLIGGAASEFKSQEVPIKTINFNQNIWTVGNVRKFLYLSKLCQEMELDEWGAGIQIGSRVLINGEVPGILRYIGPLHFQVYGTNVQRGGSG